MLYPDYAKRLARPRRWTLFSPGLFRFPLVLLLLFPLALSAQRERVDSLLAVWQNDRLNERERVAALVAINDNRNYTYVTPDSLIHYGAQAYAIAERYDSVDWMLELLFFQGIGHYYQEEFHQTLDYYQRGLDTAEARDFHAHDFNFHNGIANVHSILNNRTKAIEHYHEALRLAEANNDQLGVNAVNSNIGLVYIALEEYETALRYSLPAIDADSTLISPSTRVLRLYNVGNIYSRREEVDKSLNYLHRALELVREHEIDLYRGFVLAEIGVAYGKLLQYDKAIDYLHRARAVTPPEDIAGVVHLTSVLGDIYQDIEPPKLDSAYYFLNYAYELARQTPNTYVHLIATMPLQEYYERQGQYREALEFYKIKQTIQDSIDSETNRKAVYEQEATYRYEKEKLEERIAYEQTLSKQQLRAQRRQYLLITAIVGVVLFFLWYVRNRARHHREERRELFQRIELLKEKIALKSIAREDIRREVALNKTKIEAAIGQSMGESSWHILNQILDNPSVTNKEIAEAVFLSVEGVSSSLRRMYTAFDVRSRSVGNKKVALITRAIELSLDEPVSA